MIADTIKLLREQRNLSQSELAKRIGISRSSVNAWEMGISSPSMQYIVELAQLFDVNTDYLLGLKTSQMLNLSEYTQEEISLLFQLTEYFKSKRQTSPDLAKGNYKSYNQSSTG